MALRSLNMTAVDIIKETPKAETLKDSVVGGLRLVVSKRASKRRWQLVSRLGKGQAAPGWKHFIGTWPEMDAQEARQVAVDYKALLQQAIDPLHVTKDPMQQTFKELGEKVFAKMEHDKAEPVKPMTLTRYRACFNNPLRHLHNFRIEELNPKVVMDAREKMFTVEEVKIGEEVEMVYKGRVHANKAITLMTQIFNRAKRYGFLPLMENPTSGIRPMAVKHNQHYQKLDELVHMMSVMDELPRMQRNWLKLIVLTGHRERTIRGARWDEIDWEKKLWIFPARRIKGKLNFAEDYEMLLTDQMIDILKDQWEFLNSKKNKRWIKSGWIFPSSSKNGNKNDIPMTQNYKALYAWQKRNSIEFTPHVARRTMKTLMCSSQFPGGMADWFVTEKILNHTLPKTQAAYAHGDYIQERYELQKTYGEWIEQLMGRPIVIKEPVTTVMVPNVKESK